MMSIRTIATSVVDSSVCDRLPSRSGSEDLHAATFENAAECENVADVIVHHQHFFAHQSVIGAVQAIEHSLLFDRKIRNNAMQEQRCLVQQTFGRFDSLHHDASRQRVQTSVLFRRKLFPGKDDTGKSLSVGLSRNRSSTSKPDISGKRRSSTTQSNEFALTASRASSPLEATVDVDIVMSRAVRWILSCSAGLSSTTSSRLRRGDCVFLNASQAPAPGPPAS